MNHVQEWNASCVDDELTRLNVTALEGDRAYDYLFYAHTLPRRNDGRLRGPVLKRYQHLQAGGWWCSGIDVLTGKEDLWGCFKPDLPRFSADRRKPIKYEHPPKAETGVFALRVPQAIWEKIAARYKVEILPEDIDETQPDRGFWHWLMARQIPLCVTEGAKKAGALLTAGYAAIALPGVNGGYRTPKDIWGNRTGKSRLIPQLAKLATTGRIIYIVFDQDSKPNTVKAVNGAIRRTGYLLAQKGCTVNVITWKPTLGKGADDLIASQGQPTFDLAYTEALPLDTWKAASLCKLTYAADLQLNCRYLAKQEIPETAQLIGIKSPKGTGKTQFLEGIVKEAIARGQWVLVIGHRIQLVRGLCQRFGLNYITEVQSSEDGATLGYGLCIDSLHPNSQAQFKAGNWEDGVVILDEVEQVLWHGLNSSTCRNHRVAILKSLKTLMQNVLGGSGKVFAADADLSDTSLDYLLSLAGVTDKPFIIQNDWKPSREEAWRVYNYRDRAPKRLVKDLEAHIQGGGKPFVCLSAQKLTSQWGTRSLEAYLNKQFPQAKILRIDSESVRDPQHPAYDCTAKLNEILRRYDVVLASPSIETGVSLDLRGHFTSVWAIAQGVQAENAVRQALARVRENVPRYIWLASYGLNKVGNGSTSIAALLNSGQKLTQLNIRLLQQSDFDALDDFDTGFQAESLLCWGRFAVRCNTATIQYRNSILAALQEEGHEIVEAAANCQPQNSPPAPTEASLNEAIAAVRTQNYQAECAAIATATDLSSSDYQALGKRMVKTVCERRSQRKHALKLRYGIPVTPELVVKDDEGWYSKLRLHYFLTVGREHLSDRDASIARQLLEQGQGSIFAPDFNRSQLGAVVGIMDKLGIPVLLADEERELRSTDADLQEMAAIALSNRTAIKTALGIGLAKTSSPITIVRRFLNLVGYGTKFLRIKTHKKKRTRIYQVENPQDGRCQVFQRWLAWDGNFEMGQGEQLQPYRETSLDPSPYVQLSLGF